MGHLADRILALHGWAVLAVVFLLPALEASAFVGLVVPGEVAALLGGVLAAERRASLPAVVAAAVAGAIVGDSVGYLVGRRWGRRILDGSIGRLLKREHLDRAERYLAERGGAAVFLGRFTAALRVLVPGLAGMARLDYRVFAVWNAAGGTVWATGFVLLGYAAGTSWRRVEAAAKRASLVLLLALAVLAAIALAARWLARNQDRVRAFADRQASRPRVASLRARYQSQLAFLARRLRPQGALGLALTVEGLALAAAGWAFGALLQDVLAHDELALVDGPVHRFFAAHREAWLTTPARALAGLGGTTVLAGLALLTGLAWWWRTRSWRPLGLLAGAGVGAWALHRAVAVLVRRPGPPAAPALERIPGDAFPSGRAAAAVAVYGVLAALLAGVTTSWTGKVALWAAAAGLAALVGLAELYLGGRWLTDVLGGAALGAAWLFALLAAVRAVQGTRAGRALGPGPGAGARLRRSAAIGGCPPRAAGRGRGRLRER